MSQGTFQGIATLLAMIAFLGVCWWAFSSYKQKDFEEAAQLPFAEDEPPAEDGRQTEDDHQTDADREER